MIGKSGPFRFKFLSYNIYLLVVDKIGLLAYDASEQSVLEVEICRVSP